MPPLSRSSSTTSITKPDPVALEYELASSSHDFPTATFARHHRLPRPAKTHLKGHFTPQTHPRDSYNRYLTVRSCSLVFCLSQIILVSIAASGAVSRSGGGYTVPLPASDDNPAGDPGRKLRHWLDPCLSPPISAFCWCASDLFGVWRWERRVHHIARGVYDAVLAIGFVIAGGFFVHMARGVLSGEDRRLGWGNGGEMVLGWGIVFCMIGEM